MCLWLCIREHSPQKRGEGTAGAGAGGGLRGSAPSAPSHRELWGPNGTRVGSKWKQAEGTFYILTPLRQQLQAAPGVGVGLGSYPSPTATPGWPRALTAGSWVGTIGAQGTASQRVGLGEAAVGTVAGRALCCERGRASDQGPCGHRARLTHTTGKGPASSFLRQPVCYHYLLKCCCLSI